MKHVLECAVLLGLTLCLSDNADAQIRQSGNVTPTHVSCWTTAGIVQDCGASTSPFATTFGVLNGTGSDGICVQSDKPTAAGYQRACLGATTTGGAVLSVQNFGTAPVGGFAFQVNGSTQAIPTITLPVVNSDLVCFSGTTGTLIDCGIPSSAVGVLAHTHIYVGNSTNVATDFGALATFADTGGLTLAPSSGVPLTITGPSNSLSRNIDITQSYGGVGTNTQANQLSISDSANITGAANGLNITHVYGGGASQGSRNAVQVGITLAAPTNSGNPSGTRFYTALTVNAQANTGDGGGSGTEHGSIIGFNPTCTLGSSATFMNECSAMQVQVATLSGSSVLQRAGITISDISGASGSQGSQFDAAIAAGNIASSPGFKNILLLDGTHFAAPPLASTGTAIKTVGAQTMDSFIDVSSATISTNLINGPSSNFVVTGAGSVSAGTWNGTAIAVAKGGTNCTSASITCFNNITGFTASGTTGTTSTNLVFSTSPTLLTPVFTTSATTALLIGGTTASSTLTLESTSAAGTTDAIIGLTGSQVERFRVTTGGLFGIGPSTAAPDTLLTVNANTGVTVAPPAGNTMHMIGADAAVTYLIMDTFGQQSIIQGRRAQGTLASKTALITGNTIQRFGGDGWDGSAYSTNAAFALFAAAETWSNTAHGTFFTINTTPTTTTSFAEAIRVQASGGLSIGTTTDPGIGSLQLNAQIFMPNITTSSAAQTGTVCWTTGTGKFTVDTTVGCLSSLREAKNIDARISPEQALELVDSLSPISFHYRNGWGDGGRYAQFGLVAQEAAEVDERFVGRDPDGALQGVRYMELTAVLAGAIKKLKAENDNLRQEIRKLGASR